MHAEARAKRLPGAAWGVSQVLDGACFSLVFFFHYDARKYDLLHRGITRKTRVAFISAQHCGGALSPPVFVLCCPRAAAVAKAVVVSITPLAVRLFPQLVEELGVVWLRAVDRDESRWGKGRWRTPMGVVVWYAHGARQGTVAGKAKDFMRTKRSSAVVTVDGYGRRARVPRRGCNTADIHVGQWQFGSKRWLCRRNCGGKWEVSRESNIQGGQSASVFNTHTNSRHRQREPVGLDKEQVGKAVARRGEETHGKGRCSPE